MQDRARPLLSASLALGIGMGGFVDGILFHQILQFHNMLSARIPNTDYVGAKVNMVWDGVFHAGVWAITALGILLLWQAGRMAQANLSGRLLGGGLLMGWGLFNLVEGVIDHHLLQLHHVYEPLGQSPWDYAFLLWGLAMVAGGWRIARRDIRGGADARET
ncbi:DUF2243 domain-containing protein [Sphingomonas sp.]|uniref:DUF2243 domain-containing protein n=1 Tax=Sphingomonas sp. TaxID=28214 RepID=UPI003B3A25C8